MNLSQRMSQLGTETAFEVLARAKRLEASGRTIYNMGIGAPDFHTPANIVEAGCKALRDGAHFYTPAKGIPPLREAVCADLAARRGVEVDPEQIMIVPGGKPTMFFALLMFGEPGVEIMYPNPGFPIYESMIKFSGATPVPIALKESAGFSFSVDEVLEQITPRTRLLIVNSPANPTGGIVPKPELDKLVAGLEAHRHVTVLSDEIYSRILYDGHEHTTMLAYPSMRERLIVLDGWSKTYSMTGWRLGWGYWPKHLIAHAERLQINSNSCPSAPVQFAGIEALAGPQDAVDTMVKAFDERRKVIVDGLNDVPGFSCVMPRGAFYAFPNVQQTGIASKDLERKLLDEAGVAVLSGTSFGAHGDGYLRFSYAASVATIEAGLQAVRECVAALT